MNLGSFFINLGKILTFFVLISIAAHFYPGMQYFMQGVLFILFWGTWIRDDGSDFARDYGKYFNWIGAVAILNGVIHFALQLF